MRTLEEIRTEMADAASYYKYAKEAGVEIAAARHEAVYGALAWVLEEPWKNTGEFDEKNEKPAEAELKVVQRDVFGNETGQAERTIWSDNSVTYRHRERFWDGNGGAWSEWKEGTGEDKKKLRTQFLSLTNHDTVEIETSIWSDDTVSYRHRVRTNGKTTDWSAWEDGDKWFV